MVKVLLGGLLGRLAGYAVLGLGFWLLFRGFMLPNIVQAGAGGGLVLAGMYLMVKARRSSLAATPSALPGEQEEKSG
ncbi:MAG: hypothetical protein EXR54_04560 [Dehalococcoidia bacterium]|nr:hypothetical protein [Dehalococcoidia bacterium]MSQ16823.1 hypothetical protein [Dehalococcoidia bacterium]